MRVGAAVGVGRPDELQGAERKGRRALAREARLIAAECGVELSAAAVSVIVARWLRRVDRVDDETALLRRYVLTFADPTGERAARNLDREGWAAKARERADRRAVSHV